jgi:signal transduction histidine kinase
MAAPARTRGTRTLCHEVRTVSAEEDQARRALTDVLIAGLTHDLNGRLGALIGVAHLARSASAVEDDLLDVMDEQIRRLRESVSLLRTIPITASQGEPPVVTLSELVNGAIRLYRARGGPVLASIQVVEGDAGVITAREPLVETLLLLFAIAERGPAGSTFPVRVTFGAGADGTHVRIERCGPGPADDERGLGGVAGSAFLAAAMSRIAEAGGRIDRVGPGVFEVWPQQG